MKKTENKHSFSHRHLRVLVFASILCALTVILAQYASIKIGSSHRIGFGSLPILLAGCFFGPIVGMAVGLVGDLVGCAMFYGLGSLVPLVTLGCVAEGFLAGLLRGKLSRLSLITSAFVPHIVGSMFLKSLGLWLYYKTPFDVLIWRVPVVIAESALMAVVLVLIVGNPAIQKAVKRLMK